MKLTAIIFLTFLLSCGDGLSDYFNPKDAAQIEGYWSRQHGVYTTYYFSNGLAVVNSYAAGQVVIHREYAYHTQRDTVFFQEVPAGDGGKWLVSFRDENTVEVVATVDSVSLFFTLKRL